MDFYSIKELLFFLSTPFPKQRDYEITYLDIVNIRTKENAISKIYAHYLNLQASPKISEWFISSLLDLIETKSNKKIELKDYDVFLEYVTLESLGRIDIVIDSKATQSAILIENKVYHWLHNDLANYWDTFLHYESDNKVGIILALINLPSSNSNFISISHIEWISKMEEYIDFSILSDREKIHLEDFIINIKYITNETVMNDNIKFYLDHSSKIEQVLGFKEEASRFVNAAINSVATKYNWDVYGGSNNFKQIWDKNNDVRVFYTLFPDEILQKKELKLVVEIDDRARGYYDNLIIKVLSSNVFDSSFIKSDFKNKNSAHIGFIVFKLTESNLENLSSFIDAKISELESKRNFIHKQLVALGYEDKTTLLNENKQLCNTI